jgi:hypothetical protein
VRSAALSIVEHPHFTPERIRRLVTDRLETLPQLVVQDSSWRVRVAVERELASPTEAMRTSFRALEDEQRELLVALLDAPAGLIDERELAATVRRHHAGGLSRSPGELIDRLTDHFLRITPMGIGWVHPSWRDLVINELREDTAARRRFLGACDVDGTMLALSQEGGIAGERSLPLLMTDADWDLLGDRLRQLVRELEDQDLARVLLALRGALSAGIEQSQKREARGLAEYILTATARCWNEHRKPLPVFLVEAWYALNDWAPEPADPPRLGPTWAELYPGSPPVHELERSELARADEWLALVQTLARYDPKALGALGFFERAQELLEHLIDAIERTADADTRPLAESVLARIQELAPEHTKIAHSVTTAIQQKRAGEQRWWVPEDISAPPSTEPVATGRVEFTREDVDRVLSDL